MDTFSTIQNFATGLFGLTGVASKSEAKHPEDRDCPAQEDMAGRKRAHDEQETSSSKMMRPPLTKEEMEARAMETVSRGPAHATSSYSGVVTGASRAHRLKEEADTPAGPRVRNDGARALSYVDSGSSQPTGFPAIDSLRNNTHHAVRETDGNMGRLRSRHTPHEQLLPPPPAATSRNRSSREPEQGNQSMESEIERVRKELVSAKEELYGLRRDNEWLINERKEAWAKLQDERSNAEKEIREMKIVTQRAQANVQSISQELSRSKADRYNLRQEVDSLKESTENSRALETKLRDTEAEIASTRRNLEVTTNQLKVTSERMEQMSVLLQDRTFELKGAQSFLTTADASSGADVISMLQRLNAEILQSAAYMAESIVDAFPFQSGGVRDDNACEMVRESFGMLHAHYLATKKHKDDPLLIQITFQSCFVQFLEFVIRSWTLPDNDTNSIFTSTYERIRVGEAQAVSGRWRALTIAYAPSHDESQLIAQVTSYLAGRFANIMLAAGCSASPDVLRASAGKRLSDKIKLLFKLAIQLKRIMMEEITSADLRTVTVSGGAAYSAEEMEDAYVDGNPATSGVRVLCTTDLGLSRTTKLATSGENQWDIKLLLKPKVALETVVNSMDE